MAAKRRKTIRFSLVRPLVRELHPYVYGEQPVL
jgi:hypothetical protein